MIPIKFDKGIELVLRNMISLLNSGLIFTLYVAQFMLCSEFLLPITTSFFFMNILSDFVYYMSSEQVAIIYVAGMIFLETGMWSIVGAMDVVALGSYLGLHLRIRFDKYSFIPLIVKCEPCLSGSHFLSLEIDSMIMVKHMIIVITHL